MPHFSTANLLSGMNTAVRSRMQREFAQELMRDHPNELLFDTEDEIVAEIRSARQIATQLGITDPQLRVRFLMIHLMVYPYFWSDPVLESLLRQPTGSPENCFLDLCETVKVSYARGGYAHLIWW